MPLLKILDAPISGIPALSNPPSPFKCTLQVPSGEVDKMQELLPGIMPVLSERRLVTVFDPQTKPKEEPDEQPE